MEEEVKKNNAVKIMPDTKDTFSGLDLAYRTNKTLKLCEQLFVDHILDRASENEK